jgi:hypothetical protein
VTMSKRFIVMVTPFAAGIAVGLCWSNLINAQPAAFSPKQVFKTDLAKLPGQEVLIFSSAGIQIALAHPSGWS